MRRLPKPPTVPEVHRLSPPDQALIHAIGRWDVRGVQQALSEGANPNVKNLIAAPDGPLRLAFQHMEVSHWSPKPGMAAGSRPVMEALLAAGADAHARNAKGETLWHHWVFRLPYADARENPWLADCLLAQGVDLNAPRTDGVTPLALALDAGREEQAQWLVGQGATLTATGPRPHTVLEHLLSRIGTAALHEEHVAREAQWVERYLEQPAEVLAQQGTDGTSMGEFAIGSHVSILQRLHAAGVDWNVPVSRFGRTALTSMHPLPDGGEATVRAHILQDAASRGLEDVVAFFHAIDLEADLPQRPTASKAPAPRRLRL